MGGTVAVCVRHADGRLVCGHAWTGALSPFHHETAFIDDVDAWLGAPPIDPELGRGSLAPAGYGLVVYDRVSHTVVSLNAHATPGEKSGAFLHLLHEMGGYEHEQPSWDGLNARGLLSTGPWFDPAAPRRTLDPSRTILEQLPGIPSRDRIQVDMSPWRIVVVEDRAGLEAALAGIGLVVPDADLADWDDHFEE